MTKGLKKTDTLTRIGAHKWLTYDLVYYRYIWNKNSGGKNVEYSPDKQHGLWN